MIKIRPTLLIPLIWVFSTALPVLADEEAVIIKNLGRPTKYYEQADVKSNVLGEWLANQKFDPSIKVIALKDGFAKFKQDDKFAWVLLRNVTSDRKIRMSEACGAMPDDKIQKSATTRGVGEPCKK